MKPSQKQNLLGTAIMLLLAALLLLVSWHSTAAQDAPTPTPEPTWCVTIEPDAIGCLAPAVTAIATPTATPVMAPSPEATPVIVRPFPLGPCRLSPGCVLPPLVVTP